MKNEIQKKEVSELDEDFLMNIMADGVKKEGINLPPKVTERQQEKKPMKPDVRERSRTKKSLDDGYEHIFFKRVESNARNGKSVYIRPDFHERLSRIVQVIGEDKISIYAYLENVLEHHFEEFADDIIKSFNDKYKPIL